MNSAEAFMQGTVACEVEGCTEKATTAVKDFGHLFDQGSVATKLVQIGPTHFLCDTHKRGSLSLKRVGGQWVPF